MRRWLGMGAGILMLVAILGSNVAASGASGANRGHVLTVVERATTDAVIDLGDPGDSIGDLLVFGNDIYDRSNTKIVGRDEGSCSRTNPGLAWECSWTTILAGGSLTVQGPFYDDLRDSRLAITGGTGAYWNARGEMILRTRDDLGSELDFEFHIIR